MSDQREKLTYLWIAWIQIQHFAKGPFMCHLEKEKGNYDKNESFGLLSLSNFLIKNRCFS